MTTFTDTKFIQFCSCCPTGHAEPCEIVDLFVGIIVTCERVFVMMIFSKQLAIVAALFSVMVAGEEVEKPDDVSDVRLEILDDEYEKRFLKDRMCEGCAQKMRLNLDAPVCGVRVCNCSNGENSDLRPPRFSINGNSSLDPIALQEEISTFNIYCDIPAPRLHCKESTFMSFRWKVVDNTFYYLAYYDNKYQESETNLTRCGYDIISDLAPDTKYRVTLYAFTILEDGNLQLCRSRGKWFETRKYGFPPSRVRNSSISQWQLERNDYSAVLNFVKSRQPACYYEIVWFGDDDSDYQQIDFTDPLAPPIVNLTGLSFGQEYSIGISPYTIYENYRFEGEKLWLNVTVPTCMESFGQLSRCAPEQPKNVTVDEKPKQFNKETKTHYFDIHLHWSEPAYIPNYYAAVLHVYWDKDVETLQLNVSGDNTEATFEDVELGPEYQVLLVAYSRKGPSDPAIVHRHVNGSFELDLEDNPALTVELIIMFIICPLIILGIAVMVLVNYFLTKKVRKQQMQKYFKELDQEKFSSDIVRTSISTVSGVVERPTDKWELDFDKLMVKNILGEGEFGVVRKGWYAKEDGVRTEVAIKMLKENPTLEEMKQFYQEIEIMKSVPPHSHLVSFIGCVSKGNPLLVVEYCSKGDLQTYLRAAWKKLTNTIIIKDRDDPDLKPLEFVSNKMYDFSGYELDDIPQPKDLLSFARQIAIGMEHLASLKLIHRDLAARNILVQDTRTVKISDFGLSRDVYYDNVYCKQTGGKLPIRWMALESMTHQFYTTQSDVWSYGVLLWEIVTMGGTPYPGVATQDLLGMLKQGYRMERPPNSSEELYAIMSSCWKANAKERPTFSDLRKTFDNILERVSQYLNLDFSDSKEVVDSHFNKTYFQERYTKSSD